MNDTEKSRTTEPTDTAQPTDRGVETAQMRAERLASQQQTIAEILRILGWDTHSVKP
jgi:hypothetical protein